MKRFTLEENRSPFRAQVRHHHRSGSRPAAWKQWIDERPSGSFGRRWLFRISLMLFGLMLLGAVIFGFMSGGLV